MLRLGNGSLRITDSDEYLGRLVKLIPAEVVALYLTFREVASSWLNIWGWICLILVFIVRIIGTYNKNERAQKFAVVVACVSYVLWIYAIGDHLIDISLPNGAIPATIGVWTFLVPYFYKGD